MDILKAAKPKPARAATPESSRETVATETAQAAAADVPAPSPLTYKGLSVTRPRGRKLWTGSLVAAVLAGVAVTPLILRGELLHSLRGSMYSAVASFATRRAAAANNGAVAFPAPSRDVDSSEKEQIAALMSPENSTPIVASIQAASGKDDARVVVLLNSAVQFESARIGSPDRIYFDLHNVRLSPGVAQRITPADSDNGLLKWVRAAQNTDDVVRVVLDAGGAKYYSAQVLTDPYRLVIDVHAQPVTGGANPSGPQIGASTAPSAVAGPAARIGSRSLARALGLKINRIAIDPGHGGSDTGAMGPHGLLEKDLCLDVAMRLGQLIENNISGAEVVYTRKDDSVRRARAPHRHCQRRQRRPVRFDSRQFQRHPQRARRRNLLPESFVLA